MRPSAQLILEQLEEIIEDLKNTDKGAREIDKQVADGEEVLNLENISSVLSTLFNTMNKEFEHECLDAAVRLLNAFQFTNQQTTVFQTTRIQSQACPERCFWHSRFRLYNSM